jgi:hypothetical protein
MFQIPNFWVNSALNTETDVFTLNKIGLKPLTKYPFFGILLGPKKTNRALILAVKPPLKPGHDHSNSCTVPRPGSVP